MKYIIFHPMNTTFNHELAPGSTMFAPVAVVEADDMEGAYVKAQNHVNPEYAARGNRSTYIGDIIQSYEQVFEDKCCIVGPECFVSLPASTYLNYVDKDFLEELEQPLPSEDEDELEDADAEWNMIEQSF